jgi:hypothetical protein
VKLHHLICEIFNKKGEIARSKNRLVLTRQQTIEKEEWALEIMKLSIKLFLLSRGGGY